MLPESGAGAPEAIEPTRSAIRQAGKDELAEYFANPRVSGIALAELEAKVYSFWNSCSANGLAGIRRKHAKSKYRSPKILYFVPE